jgi:polyhydroxyalkanoate synthesis regulator phasin
MRTEFYFSRNEANALAKKFRLHIQDRTPIAQLRGDRDALQKRVKDLKAELATLRERHWYGKP